jgi:RNA-splicing ligase RtcB
MRDIIGKYCKDCKIFTDNVEDEALSLIYDICNHPVFDGAKIRIMPDTHAGKGIVIGFSCPITEGVSPAHVGCDIGCSMTTIVLSGLIPEDKYAWFEHRVKTLIPTGFNLRPGGLSRSDEKLFYAFLTNEYNKARSAWPEMIPEVGRIDEKFVANLLSRVEMDAKVFYKSLGTLGGGNHFMEYGTSGDKGFFTVHCGSRNFGLKVFNYWNKISNATKVSKETLKEISAMVKEKYPNDKTSWKARIDEEVENLKKHKANGYVYGEDLKGYLSDMVIAQAYAAFNHKMIVSTLEPELMKAGIKVVDRIFTTHNYIDFTDHIIRKGAINAAEGNVVIIPFNMRDGIAICRGKGNEDWNCTAPHGAGRIMSRSKAKKMISLDEFKSSMEGIYSTSICNGTLDESPMVYKDMNEIVELIEPTVDILYFIKPRINIKATDGGE